MENKFTAEQIESAKACKTVGELIAFAKENGITLTEEEATNYLAKLTPANGELPDSQLEKVAGGAVCQYAACYRDKMKSKSTQEQI